MKNAFLLVTAALCSVVYSKPASAQVDLQITSDYMTQTALSNVMVATMNGHAERDAARLKRQGKRASRTDRRSRQSSGSSTSTRFSPSLAARRSTLARLVSKTRAVDPQGALRLQSALGGSDPIASLAPTLRRYGLRSDDAADAMAIYLVAAWYGVRGRDEDPPRAFVRGVRTQMHRALPAVPAFRSASNAAKQQMADSLFIQTIVAAQSIGAAKGNAALMARTRQAIRQGAQKTLKLDLGNVKLTAAGFQR